MKCSCVKESLYMVKEVERVKLQFSLGRLVGLISLFIVFLGLVGCGTEEPKHSKVLHYGTTAYGPAMENAGLNPHVAYQGWSAVRYGVGETLVRFTETMEVAPWLADSWQRIDDHTVRLHIREGVTFSNGKPLTAEAVKQNLEALVRDHDRAPKDLKIESITADDAYITIQSVNPVAVLLTFLADPYSAIVDLSDGAPDGIVVGTGPFKATKVSESGVSLVRNEHYWGGMPKLEGVEVIRITDGDTLTMALQKGDIEATQGLPYSSLNLFADASQYTISSAATSRVYQIGFNFKSPAMQDVRVRQAIASAINKEQFAAVLLKGNGIPAVGPFPNTTKLGQMQIVAPSYDENKAKALLAEAGYKDTDSDGYVDKGGVPLTLRWLTYTSRQELPLLAESAQATLKQIGVKVDVNATDAYRSVLQQGKFDVFAKAFVTAPTGDGTYYFKTNIMPGAVDNVGHYEGPQIVAFMEQLDGTVNPEARQRLFEQMTQQVLTDNAFIYVAHLKMNLVMAHNVINFKAYPTDYYEITKDIELK